MSVDYQAVIGLEVHCQLSSKTKLFCADSYLYGQTANTQVGPVTLALPGTLPVLNEQVLCLGIRAGLALNCKIASVTKFDRKHYFYPDLPKGYQISQNDLPYATQGYLQFRRKDQEPEKIRIHRIHIEEDAGKLIHTSSYKKKEARSYVDLNRSGVPLLEIVTEPDLRSAQDASDFLQNLRSLLRAIEIFDGNMEEGSLRCDANVSLRPDSKAPFGTRVEIKNLNSFKAVRDAIEYEMERQEDLLENNEKVIQSTVLWDSNQRKTILMRTKEDAEDYRYFPEPDLLPIHISPKLIEEVRSELPELPEERYQRYVQQLHLPQYDADVLIREKEVAKYFEEVYSICDDAKKSANWVKDEVLGVLNKQQTSIEKFPCTAQRLGRIILLLNKNKITSRMAKQIFEHIYTEDIEPEQVIEKYNYKPVDIGDLTGIVNKVFDDNQENVKKILGGNDRVKGHLVGQVMKVTRGQAPPDEVNRIINEKLAALKSA